MYVCICFFAMVMVIPNYLGKIISLLQLESSCLILNFSPKSSQIFFYSVLFVEPNDHGCYFLAKKTICYVNFNIVLNFGSGIVHLFPPSCWLHVTRVYNLYISWLAVVISSDITIFI